MILYASSLWFVKGVIKTQSLYSCSYSFTPTDGSPGGTPHPRHFIKGLIAEKPTLNQINYCPLRSYIFQYDPPLCLLYLTKNLNCVIAFNKFARNHVGIWLQFSVIHLISRSMLDLNFLAGRASRVCLVSKDMTIIYFSLLFAFLKALYVTG